MDIKKYKTEDGRKFSLKDFDPGDTGGFGSSESVIEKMRENTKEIAKEQDKLYADGKHALLIIVQAMDTGGKDSAIKHVMSGVNPQGIDVYSFKQPSAEELSHDYLWRAVKVLPARGKIAIFNRSYYEDVLIGKVHKLYEKQNLPERCKTKDTITKRYKQICNFEDYLWENGIITVKFFLNLSKEEQRARFLARIDKKHKNWKFSDSDLRERAFWDDYQEAYESAITATATKKNPWYIIPADKKWFSRAVISEVLLGVLKDLDPKYPAVTKEQENMLKDAKQKLLNEK